ncbi:aromatic amino acid lyase [Vibrio lentus]|nr:aromatic amino acid lyase [Vibrio lentus]
MSGENMLNLLLKPGLLGLPELRKLAVACELIASPAAIPDDELHVVEQVIAEDRTVYGINTGFGLLANTKIAPEDLSTTEKYRTFSRGGHW